MQALWAEPEGGPVVKGQTITEQVLNILEVILLEASEQPPETYSVSLCWQQTVQCADNFTVEPLCNDLGYCTKMCPFSLKRYRGECSVAKEKACFRKAKEGSVRRGST